MNTKAKILIVDDQKVNRMTIKISLKGENYDFFEASNGLEAILKATEIKPDIILMDALMPFMNGFEATRKIRDIEDIQRIPILMITSLDQKEDKIKALESGVNDFISKPFDKLELKARCKSYTEISTLNKKYTLATKNPITNLPNKMALLKDISSKATTQEIFLIKIDNYDINENFYGAAIVQHLEIEFAKYLLQHKKTIGEYNTYHLSSGKFALLLSQGHKLEKNMVIEFCTEFTEHTKKAKCSHNGYYFDVNVTMCYTFGTKTLYEDANAVLSTAIMNKKDFLLSCNVLDSIKNSFKKNLQMHKSIKIALKNDKILPFFQPIYDINRGKINKHEALVRMYDEHDNLISPGPFFLDVAKKGKLYPRVTKVLLQKVLKKIRTYKCEISINLSSIDIEDVVMSEHILEVLKQNSDISNKIIFELLEDKETQNYEYVNNFIKNARKYGVKIAIDDFGSGYSNFIRIIEFQPDIIKIDGSLIEDLEHSLTNRKTVESIKMFADKIGAKTVAEYVINEETFNIVKELGIDFAQGFYIGKPNPKLMDEEVINHKLVPAT